MPIFDIHWKGYPHRRLPRIRVGSASGVTVRSRSVHRVLADNIQLRQERKQQKFVFRRHRSRKSRSSSSAARARRYASLRARQHIQVFGWDTDNASKANTVKSVASSIKAPQLPALSLAPEGTFSQTTVIDSNDGAAASACRIPRTTKPENIYTLKNVAEVPVYWTSRGKPPLGFDRAVTRSSRDVRGSTGIGPLDLPVRRLPFHPPRRLGKSRTYDTRIDPRSPLDRDRPTKSVPANPVANTRRTASRPAPRTSWQSPELKRILSTKVAQARARSKSISPSMKSIVQSILSDPASRTPSQRKAIKRFTRELELYLQAAKSIPKHSLVPSPSVTTVSAHTIEELRPYQSQFQSAGLAVTAADQLRVTSIMAKLQKPPSPPPTPPKDGKYTSRKSAARSKMEPVINQVAQSHHHHKIGSIASFESGSTVMDFTPPHEQIGPRARGRRRSSSDHTIMAFTPPHEKPPPPPTYSPPTPPRPSAKKSLPWLRKKDPIEDSAPTSPKGKGVMTAKTAQNRTRNPSDVLLYPSARNPSVEKKKQQPEGGVSEYRPTQIRKEDRKSSTVDVVDRRRLYYDAAIQAAPELSDDFAYVDQGVQYADAITQTDFAQTGSPAPNKQDDVERRALLVQSKSKTFPLSSAKCVEDCSHPVPLTSPDQGSRNRYTDQAIQTDLMQIDPNTMHMKTPESKQASFKIPAPRCDPNRTFPFVSPSPFRRSLLALSPHRSVDEGAVSKSVPRNEHQTTKQPTTTHSLATRLSPWPLRCTQCSAEIKPTHIEPQVETPVQTGAASSTDLDLAQSLHTSESIPEILPRQSHTCTARSSLECQQCGPNQAPMSVPLRLQTPDSVRSPARQSRRSPIRTAHWAATLEAELEGIIQGYQSPEERFLQRKIIQDNIEEYCKTPPLADPVKKHTPPLSRLRVPHHTYNVPKHEEVEFAAVAGSAFVDATVPQPPTVSSTSTRDSSGISDRAVFRGLHVATAAACDEDVAKWIEEMTGIRIRKFLADLSAFDGLGFNTLAGVARRAAKQRRGEVKAWEKVREQKIQERDIGQDWEDCAGEDEKGVCKDRKMGFVAGYETAKYRAERDECCDIDQMIPVREGRIREGLTERAIRMGWRDRSVSGGDDHSP